MIHPARRLLSSVLFAGFVIALLALSPMLIAAPATMPALPDPQQAVVVDLHRPWLDGTRYDKDVPSSVVYGVDETGEHPKFTVVDSNVRAMWLYRFAMPIDAKLYPIVTMKYRASNISNSMEYALRLVRGGDNGKGNGNGLVRVPVGTGADLICDGQVHELTKDLRELNLDTSVASFGIGVKTDQQPASLELLDLRFAAAPNAPPAPALKEDAPLVVHVVDDDDKPLAGVRVIVDAERANFAREGKTGDDGSATIKPLVNEQNQHMVRIEKPGFVTVEKPATDSESGQGIEVKTVPAKRYGGIAKSDDGKPIANAQVLFRLSAQMHTKTSMRNFGDVITNEKGEWSTLPLPADVESLTTTLTQRAPAEGQEPIVTQLSAADYQLPDAPAVAVVDVAAAQPAAETTAPAPQAVTGTATVQGGGTVVVQATAVGNGQIQLVAAPAQAGAQPVDSDLPPEKAVVLDLHRPWLDGSKMDGNKPPAVSGVDQTSPQPRFTVVDPNSLGLWFYRFALPIDVMKYPMLSMKYRAQNTSKDAVYVLRLVFQQGDTRSRNSAWTGADLVADGQEHELTIDLRTVNGGDPLMANLGLAVKSDDKPASIDLTELKFSAAADAANEKPKDDIPVKLHVTDVAGNSLANAKVIVDAERANFARAGQTDKDGNVSIVPLINEAGKHMVRVEKDGDLTVESANTTSESGQAVGIKMIPAVSYGGIAKGGNGAIAALARVTVNIKPELLSGFATIQTNVLTDESGQWATPPLPADASQLTIQLNQRDPSGDASVTELEAAKFQLTKPGIVAKGAAPNHPTTGPAAAVAKAQPEKVNAVTAIIQKIDDSTTAVGLTGIDQNQLQVMLHPHADENVPSTIPLMDVTDVIFKKAGGYSTVSSSSTPTSRPTDRLANCRVLMADEDRMNGDIVGWSDKRITLRPNVAPKMGVEIPVSRLREIWCGTADQVKKAQDLHEQSGVDDVLFAVKEDEVIAVHGIVIDIRPDGLHFRFGEEDRKIALNRVVGLRLAKPDETAAADDSFYQVVQFITDEQLSGNVTAFDGKQLTMKLRADGKEVSLPLDQVAKISTRNGRLVFLSDMKPTKVEQTPYFDRLIPYRMNQSLAGKPIVLLDGTYPKGISVHSRCVLTFNLDGRFDELRTKVGFALPEGKLGQAVLRVIGDGKTLYENLDAHGDQPPSDVKTSVAGVHELTLEVDYGKNDDTADRVTWANPRLLRAAAGH